MDNNVSLDRTVFPYQDIWNKGGKIGIMPKQKKGCKLATTFAKPFTPVQGGIPVSNSNVDKMVKEKHKRKATPPFSAVLDGAVGGRGSGESSTNECSSGDPPPSLESTKGSVAQLKAHIIDSRGEC